MEIIIQDLGAKIGNDNKIYSIGQTSILLEWKDEQSNSVLYRMMLDMGLKGASDNKIDLTNIIKIKNVMEDKVPGYESGIQTLLCSHCHEDHIGAYPWFYQYCKDKGIPINGIPKLYMTGMTKVQFVPFQNDLFELFEKPAENTGYKWEKGIINEISQKFIVTRDYYSEQTIKASEFDIRLKFIPAGHIVGSAMIELDTLKEGKSLGKILFTGDTCFRDGGFLIDPINQSIIKDVYKAVIMEGTYLRNTNEPEKYKKLRRPQLREMLKNKIIETFGKGGNLILLVYGIDRTANAMVALREIIDEGIEIDLRGKIFLDTAIGGTITHEYMKEFEAFVKFENPIEEYSYFRKELVQRYNNGLGASILQISKDKSSCFEYIRGMDIRKEHIEKFRDGGCITVSTSATLMGGTALMSGGYMHPDGWGSDKKHLFLIVGSAIPTIKAKIAMNEYESKNKCNLTYWNLLPSEDGKMSFYPEESTFTGRLEELKEFSAHANHDELLAFRQRVNTDTFIITHIGGNKQVESTQNYVSDKFKALILTGENKFHVPLDNTPVGVSMDNITYNMLRVKTLKDKGYYSDINACNVIKKLISEDDKKYK